ncbi:MULTISPECIES: hypothetical protein [unclassified Microbacterium]|uniref:hypothetical protein n=1 Tax=unclassified Microbacterium TaxID=2609290 RepID=UPI0028834DF0|nr:MULTISPECIES: hypothetical protein [unclassified Microbacterium]
MSSPTITAPSLLSLSVKGTAERPALSFRLSHDVKSGVYTTIHFTAEHPDVPITPTRLAKMRIGSVRRDALRSALSEKNAELTGRAAVKSYFRGSAGRAVGEKIRLEPSDEHLETAGVIYRLARLVGDFPVQAVARSFGLERDDAQRWVALTKKKGHLA